MHTTISHRDKFGVFFTDFYDSYTARGDSCDNAILNVTITSKDY